MQLPKPVFVDPTLPERLISICGADHVSVKQSDRLFYARDMWPRELIRQRGGALGRAPDLIVWPADVQELAAVVQAARKNSTPIIPFGAGSGVCGGTLPLEGGIIVAPRDVWVMLDTNKRSNGRT